MNTTFFRKALSLSICIVMLAALFCTSVTLPAAAQVYDLEKDYVLLDYSLVAASYYNSTGSSTGYATGSSDFNRGYVCTSRRFTKAEIPVGSLIYVENGFVYRPEGWKADDSSNAGADRPANVSKYLTVVDETWWGDFATRAFNISRNGEDLTEKLDEVKASFKIYVPKPKYADITWNYGYYGSTSGNGINSTASNANQFICTQIFTRETLPVGSTIYIEDGYKYRPEGWINIDEPNPLTRPGNVSTYSVAVTEEWWGEYNYRAFNVSTIDNRDISAEQESVQTKFKIQLPCESVSIPEPIRVLAIGNSFSADALNAYASNVANAMGLNVEFTVLYYGGCTLQQHYDFYTGDGAVYTHYVDGANRGSNVTMKSVLEAAQYDYISFQQGSWSSDNSATYTPYLEDLAEIVRGYQPGAQFVIHQTWGYCHERSVEKGYSDSAEMFAKVEDAYEQAAELLGGVPIVRSGKAVQILKESLGFTDDYGMSNSIYSDKASHLASRGDYAAACAWVQTLFGGDSFDIRNCTYSAGFTDAAILREAAYQAVTDSSGATLTLGSTDEAVSANGGAAATLYNADLKREIQVKTQPENASGVYTFDFTRLPEGNYYATVERNGYVTHTTETVTLTRDGKESFEQFVLISGDLKDEQTGEADGVVDILDFIRIIEAFISVNDTLVSLYDINGDGVLNIEDLALVKINIEE